MSSSARSTPNPIQPLILHIDVFVGSEFRERRAFIDATRILIGRGPDADIRFSADVRTISSSHAEIVRTEDGFLMRDLRSRNGLYQLASAEKFEELELKPGDTRVEVALGPEGPRCILSVGCVVPFADYMITGRLGEGGMATVFLAQEATQLSRLVVLKLIAPHLLLSIDPEDAKAMLQEEARIASYISHSNVVNIFKADCYEGTHFIAMEYLKGVNLGSIQRQLARQGTRCPFALAAALVSQACFGLHAAHEACDSTGKPLGIIHRDFTPSNIVCSSEGDVKLIDFGVARALGRRYLSSGQFVGKPAYASPEQIKPPQEIDRRSDVFAAGVILYELCAGTSLFLRENDFATLSAVVSAPIPPIADAPPALSDILMRALSRDPQKRPQTAAALAEELEQFALSAGGQHLQRRNMAQALGRLGVDLQAPSPKALAGRPTLLPPPPERARSRLSPEANERLLGGERSAFEPRRREGKEPGFKEKEKEPRPIEQPRLPAEIVLGGEPVRLGPQLPPRTNNPPAPFTHACYEVISAQAQESGLLPRVLHLIGGKSIMVPMEAQLDARFRQLIARWQSWEHDGPLPLLAFAGDAWPGGPLALLVAECPAEQTWGVRTASFAASAPQKQQLLHALVARLADLDSEFPGFVHGILSPERIRLVEIGDQLRPQLLFGSGFEWLIPEAKAAARALPGYELSPYCAPEVQKGEAPTLASDVFSVAALGYELLGGDLAAASLALLSGRLIPELPPHTSISATARAGIAYALHPDPQLRPTASVLARSLSTKEAPQEEPLLDRSAPPVGQRSETVLPGGGRLFLYTMQLSRSLPQGPERIPFCADPMMIPANVGLSLFRGQFAVEVIPEPVRAGSAAARPRLYQADGSAGDERLFLSEDSGAFHVGSRSQYRLQRVEFSHVLLRPDTAIELAGIPLRLRPACSGHAVLLWTREQRSGDIHVLCTHITE